MAIYATEEFCNAYLGVNDISDDEITKAEEMIDDLAIGSQEQTLGNRERFDFDGVWRKLNPDQLIDYKVDALSRATAEQVKYRRVMGEDFFYKPQRDKGSMDGVSFEGTLPHISPRALAILSDVGLVNKLGASSVVAKIKLEDIGSE